MAILRDHDEMPAYLQGASRNPTTELLADIDALLLAQKGSVVPPPIWRVLKRAKAEIIRLDALQRHK